MNPPTIKVEIIHIEGPLKGTILEFHDTPIAIGRHPDCQVTFPKDMTIISRKHADIIREGNRFKITDYSTNHTLVNGKIIEEAYLKDGDVMTISEGGPKISFISTVLTDEEAAIHLQEEELKIEETPPAPPVSIQTESPPPAPPVRAHYPEKEDQKGSDTGHIEVTDNINGIPNERGIADPSQSPVIQASRNPLIIQFGAIIKSFDTLPVTIGSSPECEFVLDHASITVKHLQIFFSEQNYQIKDLTGRSLVSINGIPIKDTAILSAEAFLALSESGPYFQFLGEGRLVETETMSPPLAANKSDDTASNDRSGAKREKGKSFWPFKS